MWILFGIGAILTAICNLVFCFVGKETKYFRFSSLSLTALTVCAFYSDGAARVLTEDWSGLEDIMPTVSKMLWVCVIASICVNAVSLLYHREK